MKKNRNKIIIGLSGGLGNQLFQYAAGKSLALKLGYTLELDLSWFSGRKDRTYALSPFNINEKKRVNLPLFPKRIQYLASKLSRKLLNKRMGVSVFREEHFHVSKKFFNIEEPVFLEGYWQSEKYFIDYSEDILNNFSFKKRIPKKCEQSLTKIKSTNSICIHIRRGDYISDPKSSNAYHSCSNDYYEKGVKKLTEDHKYFHCYVFSDDCEWAENNFSLSIPFTIVNINSSEEAHWDLLLMSSCQHFIIANSSLSWWAAWLGRHHKKKVIAPKDWFTDSNKITKDLIPEKWELL